ncbi:leucine-rich repeat domain, L domain-like protein [Tanacetum coccineum]
MDSSVTNYNKYIPVRTRIRINARTRIARTRINARTRIARTRTRRQLPDDCWCLIFEKLDNKSNRNAFGLTCQSFLDIERSTRKHLRPKDYNVTYGGPSFILNMLNRSFRQLESLSLFGCVDLSDSSLTSLLKYGSKMHTLDLSFCFRVTDKGLSYVASGCSALSSITLYRCCGISDYGLLTLTQSCKSLKHVDLSWCFKITDLGISYLYQNCHQLDTLRINGCYKILGESFLGISPTLARLDASGTTKKSRFVHILLATS